MAAVRFGASLLVVVVSLAFARPVFAETISCTPITSLPIVISQSGIYCFTGNLGTSQTTGYAIEIQTANVVIDLNGYRLNGRTAGLGTSAIGIYALNRQSITIRNGSIRGFLQGIILEMSGGVSQGHIVEDIRADFNTFAGINVQGTGIIVRNNLVVETGGSTVLGPNASAFGIYMAGVGVSLVNNDVVNTTRQGTGTGAGAWLGAVTSGFALNNRVTSSNYGLVLGGTKYRDNMTSNVVSAFVGGTDAGNNF